MRILVLGGTAWLGRTVAQEALTRGHEVTCLARGTAPVPEGAVFVAADRDADDGLAPVGDIHWDAVLDVSRQPGQVRRSVRDLRTAHHVLVSTGNVYAAFSAVEQGEDAPLRDPLDGDVMADMETYGEAKVACEQAVLASGTLATVVRSGLIGRPGDASGRTGYWPWRFAHPVGEEVVVPDDPRFPTAMVDVRDLASWMVTLVEERTGGVFNATGPTTTLREVLATAAEVAGSSARPRPVPADVLTGLGVDSWMGPASLPLWIADPDWRGFATMDTSRARAAGLVTRPLRDTLAAALASEESPPRARSGGPASPTTTSDACSRRPVQAPGPGPGPAPRRACRGTTGAPSSGVGVPHVRLARPGARGPRGPRVPLPEPGHEDLDEGGDVLGGDPCRRHARRAAPRREDDEPFLVVPRDPQRASAAPGVGDDAGAREGHEVRHDESLRHGGGDAPALRCPGRSRSSRRAR
ncbi:NAD-dependent epimerase/dehydratase family protein [Oryzobacter terrae]|uniref:NAD-dependent epimerase/dehydratase family protein n=1 Tax=Oryzobacter terrae TaxID=1620385 RepID=UPI00367353E8